MCGLVAGVEWVDQVPVGVPASCRSGQDPARAARPRSSGVVRPETSSPEISDFTAGRAYVSSGACCSAAIGAGRPRSRPDHVLADKVYTSRTTGASSSGSAHDPRNSTCRCATVVVACRLPLFAGPVDAATGAESSGTASAKPGAGAVPGEMTGLRRPVPGRGITNSRALTSVRPRPDIVVKTRPARAYLYWVRWAPRGHRTPRRAVALRRVYGVTAVQLPGEGRDLGAASVPSSCT